MNDYTCTCNCGCKDLTGEYVCQNCITNGCKLNWIYLRVDRKTFLKSTQSTSAQNAA